MEQDIAKLSKKERKELKREKEQERFKKEKAKKNSIKWFIIVLIIGLVGGGLFWIVKESSKPLPGKSVADLGREHVGKDKWEKYTYNSNPPTSGPHDPVWTTKGIYTTSSVDLGKGHLLHSLEHGYIEMHYNCALPKTNVSMDDAVWKSQDCKNILKELSDIANDKTIWKMIIVPNPTIKTKISVVAWDRIDPMNTVNKKEIENFIDSFRDHGPEQTMAP